MEKEGGGGGGAHTQIKQHQKSVKKNGKPDYLIVPWTDRSITVSFIVNQLSNLPNSTLD